jgi:hypothetical protein
MWAEMIFTRAAGLAERDAASKAAVGAQAEASR